jgi:hypothetical protein
VLRRQIKMVEIVTAIDIYALERSSSVKTKMMFWKEMQNERMTLRKYMIMF